MGYILKDIDSGKVGERQTMAVVVLFSDDGTDVSFPALPAGTILHDSHVNVITAFNDSGTDLGKLGTSGNDDSLRDTGDQTLATPALYTDTVSGAFPQVLTAATTFLARYDGENSDATTGKMVVTIEFTLMPAVS